MSCQDLTILKIHLKDWLRYPGLSEKIMFGTDAGLPIWYWIAVENSRNALILALKELIEENVLDEEKAIIVAKKILRENALKIHRIR